MQPALINQQQYAGLPTQPSGGFQPLPAATQSPPLMANTGMTQLPSIPPPPYLQPAANSMQPMPELPTPDQLLGGGNPAMKTTSYIIPGVFGNGGIAGPQNSLPTPCQVAPALCNNSAQPYQTASSFPVNMLDPEAEVPSPYMVAPWLYLAKPAAPQVPQTPAYPPQAPVMQPQRQQPKMPVQQPQPPTPPQPNPAQPPQQPPTQQKGPTTPLNDGGLTDSQIQSLNDRLNSDSEDTRADAAMELFKILDKDPTLSKRHPYSQYVNAFMEKIMKDPSAVVRTAGELALQTGRVKQPTEEIVNQLNVLNKNPGGLSGEGGVISSLIGSIKNNTLGQGYSDTPGALTTIPGTEQAAEAQQKGATTQQASPDGAAPNGQNPAQPTAPTGYHQTPAPAGAGMAQAFPAASGQAAYGQPAPVAGNRLNYVSQAQQPATMMAQTGMSPQFGQRLNLKEGYR